MHGQDIAGAAMRGRPERCSGPCKFESLVSCSEQKLANAEQNNASIGTYPAASFTSLQRAMAANNVTWIDILKIDVEGESVRLPCRSACAWSKVAVLPVRQMFESRCDCRRGMAHLFRAPCSEHHDPHHSGARCGAELAGVCCVNHLKVLALTRLHLRLMAADLHRVPLWRRHAPRHRGWLPG
jgi:hypothetical protein